jgi:putative flippase GtrA
MRVLDKAITTPVSYLRDSVSDTVGQGIRYGIAGSVVALVYLTTTTVLAKVFLAPFQLALVIGFVAGMTVHFTLQRLFVWAHHTAFALGVRAQAGRYLPVAVTQYLLTAASTSLLPTALGLPVLPIYLVTASTLTAMSFLIFRSRVFHPEGTLEH